MEKIIFDGIEFVRIPNHPRYYISKCGKVYSIFLRKLLKITTNNKGYQRVGLVKDCNQKFYSVHSLVMLSFVGERPIGYEINHIDYNPSNNNLNNLEYLTHQENVNHSLCNFKRIPIYEYTLDGSFVAEYKSIRDAAIFFNVDFKSVTSVLNKKTNTVRGRFVDYKKADKMPQRFLKEKPVIVFNKAGEYIGSFNSVKEAAIFTGAKAQRVSACCNKKRKTSNGYIFKFINNENSTC